jgi:hypothetical protein
MVGALLSTSDLSAVFALTVGAASLPYFAVAAAFAYFLYPAIH